MPRSERTTVSPRIQMLASIAIVVAGLYFAREVMIPFALAVLFSFLLAPLTKRLERWRVPRVLSVLLVVLATFIVVAGFGYIVTHQMIGIVQKLPEYRQNIRTKLAVFRSEPDGALSKAAETIKEIQNELATSRPSTKPATRPAVVRETVEEETVEQATVSTAPAEPIQVAVVEPDQSGLDYLRENASLLLAPLGTAGIVAVFVIFMLLEREDLRDRLIRLMGQGQIHLTTQALDDASSRISRYLLMQLVVNATYGIPVGIGLWLIGVPGAFMWGLLATVLRFIPYIGPWIAAATPILLSVAVFEWWLPTIEVVALYIVMELVSNNIMEPWLYGSSTGMSSLAILVAAVFWTWLWGGVGLLLATPLTVCLVVLGKYVPQLEFLSVMLGDQPVLDPPTRFYQRLLAMDADEAAEVAEEYLNEHSLVKTYDTVVVPALGMAEHDRHRGEVDVQRQEFIHQAVQDIVEEFGEAAGATVEEGKEARRREEERPRVLCLPARDTADELAGMMFAQVLDREGIPARALSATKLASEMLEQVAEARPLVVCVSALPPLASTHARYLCKRLQGRFPGLVLVVGLWNTRVNLERARARLTCGETSRLVTNFADGLNEVRQAVNAETLKVRQGPPAPASDAGNLATAS